MTDNVNHPSHYADGWSNGAEVIDITENLNFNRGNAVKYIARAGKKDASKELEDLQKAEFYLKREIARLKDDSVIDAEVVEPRVWMKLSEVPRDVKVTDKAGDQYEFDADAGDWRWGAGNLCYWDEEDEGFDGYAPFTEVIS